MIKKFSIITLLSIISIVSYAQVPYFAGTAGDGNLYGYTSLKVRPGINNIETYTTFQYGIGNYTATGLDLYTGPGSAYMGFLVRGGYKVNQYFGIGAQVTPSFNLNDSFKFGYFTGGLYLNGAITKDSKLFWCINDWFGVNRDGTYSISQWTYLGYSFSLKNGDGITPMVGMTHDWKFEDKPDMAAGLYYSHKKWNFYVWGNDFFKKNPRVVVGVDFCLPTKDKNNR